MKPKFKRYRYKDGRLYDAILYDGYNKDDIVNFLDERSIKHTCVESYIDQFNGDRKTHIDIKIDINDDNIVDVYLSPYSYLLYDIGKKYIDKCEPETLYKNFKEVSDIDDDKDTIIESSVSNVISILGTEYKLFREPSSSWKFVDGIMGRCDSYLKEISISILNRDSVINKGKPDEWFFLNEAEIVRHEIVHAFLNESGLSYNTKSSTSWATNEEMIDWIAFQVDKISKAFKEAEAWLRSQFNI